MSEYISILTTDLIGEGTKSLPFIHKTENYTGDEDDLIQVQIVLSAGSEIVPIEFLYQTSDVETEKDDIVSDVLKTAKETEPFASKIASLQNAKWKIVDICLSKVSTLAKVDAGMIH